MNDFGGNWTKEKIELFMKYVPAYLKIMHNQISGKGYNWKLMYFDGFAGSSGIIQDNEQTLLEGVATRVLSITNPRKFDLYYFVELNEDNAQNLRNTITKNFSDCNAHVVSDDFNKKIADFANFLRKPEGKNYKVLAFVDPFGMDVNWKSIENLKGLDIDMWILVPTGIGVNRLLKKDNQINEKWLVKLQNFLGLSEQEIHDNFYKTRVVSTLFGEDIIVKKEQFAAEKANELYQAKLKTIFKNVSEGYVMKNSKNSILYHFICASNNPIAIKIANQIIGKGISKL
jgi:three-Cys-motif partner protein